MRTALLSTALGAAAIALIPAAASAQHYGSSYGQYGQGGYQYDCDDNRAENAIIGGLLGAVAGGVIGASVDDDDDDRYRGRHYRNSRYGYSRHRGYDRHHRGNDNSGTVAGAVIGGALGAAVGASTGKRECAPVHRGYNAGYQQGGYDRYGNAGYYSNDRYAYERRDVYYGDVRHDPRYDDRYYGERHDPRYDDRYYGNAQYGYQQPQYAQPQAQVYSAQSVTYSSGRNYADVLAERQGGYSANTTTYSQTTPESRLLGGR